MSIFHIGDRQTSSIKICNEQESLIKAKNCTFVVESDIGHGSGFLIKNGFIVTKM